MGSLKKQLRQQLITSLLAFGVGTGLGLVVYRAWPAALLTGVIAILVGYVCIVVHDVQLIGGDRRHRQYLQRQIRGLQQQHYQLRQTAQEQHHQHQQIEQELQVKVIERDRLLNRIAELHQHRQELVQTLRSYHQQSQDRVSPPVSSPTGLPPDLKSSSLQQQDTQSLEQHLRALHDAVEQIQTKILDQEEIRVTLQTQIQDLTEQKESLTVQTQKLRVTLSTLQQSQISLKQSLRDLQDQHHDTTTEVQQQQAQLTQLYEKIDTHQQRYQGLQQSHEGLHQSYTSLQADLQTLQGEYEQLETQVQQRHHAVAMAQAELQTIQQQIQAAQDIQNSPPIPDIDPADHSSPLYALSSEWLDFVQSLSPVEKQVLNAIILDDELGLTAILETAQQSLEFYFAALNDKAIATLGDAIVEGQEDELIPYVNEDYATILAAAIAIPFHELLMIADAHVIHPTSP